MKKSRFTEEQMIGALQRLDGGVPVKAIARELGVNVQTLYRWRKKFGGMNVSDARRLKELEEENRRLKRLVADLHASGSLIHRLSGVRTSLLGGRAA